MTNQYQLVSRYKDEKDLRTSFGELAKETLGLDMAGLYDKGAWNDRYTCYSYSDNGRIVSNVSCNLLEMTIDGERVNALQLGNVMTHEDYRGQHLGQKLMAYVVEKYSNLYPVMYLFSTPETKDYFERMGFEHKEQYTFMGDIEIEKDDSYKFRKMDVNNAKDLDILKRLSERRQSLSSVCTVKHYETIFMYYALNYFKDLLYYIDKLDTVVIFKEAGDTLSLYDCLTQSTPNIQKVLNIVANDSIKKVKYYFTPPEHLNAVKHEVSQHGMTLFISDPLGKIKVDPCFPVTARG